MFSRQSKGEKEYKSFWGYNSSSETWANKMKLKLEFCLTLEHNVFHVVSLQGVGMALFRDH